MLNYCRITKLSFSSFTRFFLVCFFITKLPVFHPTLLNSDITMVLHPAKTLVETGALRSCGIRYSAQALKESFELEHQPYWFNYVMPVFISALFFKIFGTSDFGFYLMQSLGWVLLYFLLLKALKNSILTSCLFLAFIFFKTIQGTTYLSPTQLPSVLVYLTVWSLKDKEISSSKIYFYSLLIGLGLHCRPEVVWLFGFCFWNIWSKNKKLGFSSGVFILVTMTTYFMIQMVRTYLGAIASNDHTFYLLSTDVLEKGYLTMSLEQTYPLKNLLSQPQFLLGLKNKFFSHLVANLSFQGGLSARRDLIFILVAMVLSFIKSDSRSKYLILLFFLVLQLALNCLVLDLARYYDYIFVLIMLEIVIDVNELLTNAKFIISSGFKNILTGGCLVVLLIHIVKSSFSYYQYFNFVEPEHRLLNRRILDYTDRKSMLVSNNYMDLLWYGDASHVVFAPENERTLKKLIEKFPQGQFLHFTKVPQGYGDALRFLQKLESHQITPDVILYKQIP